MDKKSSNGLLILIIILLVGLIGLGGYIVYDKVITKDDAQKENQNVLQDDTGDIQSNNQTIQVLDSKIGRFIVDKDGSVYCDNPVDEYEGATVDFNNVSFAKSGTYEVEDYVTGLDYDESTKKTIELHNFVGYKLNLDNINSAYEVETGNGGVSEIIFFISKDGKVNELRFSSNGNKLDITLEKNTSNHPNIVSVLRSLGFDAATYVLVDKDGNKY